MGAVEDILEWSKTKLAPWRQDALRRLASSSFFTAQDEDEILTLIKAKVGFTLVENPPTPMPLNNTHFTATKSGMPLIIKSIRKIRGVNRLANDAELSFSPSGLTIVYGRNGSGKSGFVRILRTACRTRTDDRDKLKVLSDVYGTGGGPQDAEIIVDAGGGDFVVKWTTGAPASEELLQIAVFDSSAAQLYVDKGNQIHFLPFGLALPHQLNELCLALKAKLESERLAITIQIAPVPIKFETSRATKAQSFCNDLNAKTTDAEIAAAALFSQEDEERVEYLTRLLSSNVASAADLTAFSSWVKNLAAECSDLEQAFSNSKLDEYRKLRQPALEARTAANLSASELFINEPLSGIGGETWRRLWFAAMEYSTSDAYPTQAFPVVSSPDGTANCVLCQQPLGIEASVRMCNFQAFVVGSLAETADHVEKLLLNAINSIPMLVALDSKEWSLQLAQVRKRNAELADTIASFKYAVTLRRDITLASLEGTSASQVSDPPELVNPNDKLADLALLLGTEIEALAKAAEDEHRVIFEGERVELSDLKILTASRDSLTNRRDLLKKDALYIAALAEVKTTGITQKANELVDTHLTQIVGDHFREERETFEISHLKVGLARTSNQTKAEYKTETGTTLTKLPSAILSEGEQKALALASFLTEVAVADCTGPIVIDDPVSSLDRERGLKVAKRLVTEAKKRQVIVFTHDMIFFNDLLAVADEANVAALPTSLFSNATVAGIVDPAGVAWKGQPVTKRVAKIRIDFAVIKELYDSSPTDYEIQIKNLYGRLRDTYERVVEEIIFSNVLRRGVDRIETQKLRYVHLTDDHATRFHSGMTNANANSHDNPASETVEVLGPKKFESDIDLFDKLVIDLKSANAEAEKRRPTMKNKSD